MQPEKRQRKPTAWRWLAVIALSSCTLALTLLLLVMSMLSPRPSQAVESIATRAARDVTIDVNGGRQTWRTALDNPLEILQSAGIEIASGDRIWVNGALADVAALPDWTVPARHIKIRSAVTLTIVDDGERFSIVTAADTVEAALREAGIELHSADIAKPPLETAIASEMTIAIDRATAVVLRVDGVEIDIRTNAETVAGILAELDSPRLGLDYVAPPAESAVSENMTIEIVRVTEEITVNSESIPYQVRYQPDENLNLDERAVIQAGQDGIRELRSRVRYENGVENSRSVDEAVVEAPQDEVIGYGTKIALKTVDTPAGPRQYWRKLRMYATSYHPAALGGDSITAIGATLKKGIVAADPDIIAYRTELFVPRYGLGMMADTGGPRSSPYWIDLGYSDDDWVSWSGYVDVYLLAPAPPKINYLLPAWRPLRNRPDS